VVSGRFEKSMHRERQRRGGREERRGARRGNRPLVEPIVFAARRPLPGASTAEAPLDAAPDAAAPSEPAFVSEARASEPPVSDPSATANPTTSAPARRSARIVATGSRSTDSAEAQRERLLSRLLASEGRAMISRAADECRRAGVEFPLEQAVQLQLLEHVDEGLARDAVVALGRILSAEAPKKRPILEQRLRRLEDTADEEATRSAAAELRRSLRA
jgi:hypothetical protein